MIYLRTGQPGHGKTLFSLEEALAEAEKGRTVAVHGVPGLNYAKCGFVEITDPKDWQNLPDNTLIFIDECYTVFPNRVANSVVPPHVEALARHRHRGFDFILVCQLGNQIDPFVRGLVDTHTHYRKKFGSPFVVQKKWDHYATNVLARDSDNKLTRLPKSLIKRQLYHSTTKDSTKRHLPWYFIVGPIVVAYAAYVFWRVGTGRLFGEEHTTAPTEQAAAATTAPAAQAAGAAAPQSDKDKPMSKEEYFDRFKPRDAAAPWSAPAYDNRRIVAEPRVFCVTSGAGLDADGVERGDSCRCLTEQNTPYEMPKDRCEYIAKNGAVYNPYQRPDAFEKRRAGMTREQAPETVRPVRFADGAVAAGDSSVPPLQARYGQMRTDPDGEDPPYEPISF
ncbi:zonular occludens toxin domain-containing protein [Luteimonas panaciterrae]|uniref:zonular occludens toxin domain-containing protein n=1 Tax=Luteimonas panaciterrae TaxID=363885 RepID=UPI001CFBC185|nr:zonular occludens toxin domain-containing protein [Luteimonas panaciterrae]